MLNNDFRLANEVFKDKELNEKYYQLQDRVAYLSITLFKTGMQEKPYSLILANQAKRWFIAVKEFSEINEEVDKRWAKLELEAYKICKEIGIAQFNKLAKEENIDIQIDETDDVDEWIAYYEEKVNN